MSVATTGAFVTVIDDGVYNAFPGLVQLPNGTLVISYRVNVDHNSFGGVIKYKTSTDQGASWSVAQTAYDPGDPVNTDAADSCMMLLANGNVLMTGLLWDTQTTAKAFAMLGTVSGSAITWGAPVTINKYTGAVTACSSPAIQLGNGDLVLPIYGKDTGDTYFRASVIKSTDNGATWGSRIDIASAPATIEYTETGGILSNGDLLLLVRAEQGAVGYSLVTSSNSGATWSAPSLVINLGAAKPGRPSLIQLASGNLFLFTRKAGGGSMGRAGYCLSTDNGATWTTLVNYGADLPYVYAQNRLLQSGKIGVALAREDSTTDAHVIYQEFAELTRSALLSPFDVVVLEADDIGGADNDSIDSWASQVANVIATQPTPDNQPKLKKGANGLNGKNIVLFDGTNDYLTFGDLAALDFGTNPFSIFFVTKIASSASHSGILFKDNDAGADNGFYIYNPVSPAGYYYWNGTIVVSIGAIDTNYHLIGITRSGTAASGLILYYDGTAQAASTEARTLSNTKEARLGRTADDAETLNGSIAAVYIGNGVLSDADRNLFGGYIQNKYGITIAGAEAITITPSVRRVYYV